MPIENKLLPSKFCYWIWLEKVGFEKDLIKIVPDANSFCILQNFALAPLSKQLNTKKNLPSNVSYILPFNNDINPQRIVRYMFFLKQITFIWIWWVFRVFLPRFWLNSIELPGFVRSSFILKNLKSLIRTWLWLRSNLISFARFAKCFPNLVLLRVCVDTRACVI